MHHEDQAYRLATLAAQCGAGLDPTQAVRRAADLIRAAETLLKSRRLEAFLADRGAAAPFARCVRELTGRAGADSMKIMRDFLTADDPGFDPAHVIAMLREDGVDRLTADLLRDRFAKWKRDLRRDRAKKAAAKKISLAGKATRRNGNKQRGNGNKQSKSGNKHG